MGCQVMHKSCFLFDCQNLYIFLDGALGISFSQQFFKSQAKGRHASDPKNVSVNVSGGGRKGVFPCAHCLPCLSLLLYSSSPLVHLAMLLSLFLALHP